MALVVGLDIGTRFLKGAVFAGNASKFQLVDFFEEEVPVLGEAPAKSREEAISAGEEYVPPPGIEELIQKALETRDLRGADVVAAVDAKDCTIREAVVPFTREEQIKKTVPFEAENYFHAFDKDDVVLEYVKTGELEGKSRLILFALRHGVIEKRLQLLRQVGCDPVALDLDGAALLNAFSLTPQYDPAKSAIVIDMGATSTKIVLVEGGKLKKMRSLRTGVAMLSPERMIPEPAVAGSGAAGGGEEAAEDAAGIFSGYSLEERFREIENALRRIDPEYAGADPRELEDLEAPIAILPDDEYDRLRGVVEDAGGGAPQDQHPRQDAERGPERQEAPGGWRRASGNGAGLGYSGYLERVAVEIQRTFATTSLASPIEMVCLTGGMSRHEEARRYFSEEFDVETVQLDFGGGLDSDVAPDVVAKVNTDGAVAVGLALKGLGRDAVGIDFRKGRFRYEHRFERLKVPLLVSSVLLLLFFLQTAFWAYHSYDFESQRSEGFRREQAKIYNAFFEADPVAGLTPLEAARRQKKSWEGKGRGDFGRFLDYVDAMHDVSNVMNSTGLYFDIQTMTLKFEVRKVVRSGKAPELRAQDSSLTLTLENDRGHLTIEERFRTASKFFNATTDSKPLLGGEGYRVTVTLEVKESALQKLRG
jgi:Tfp pilus assembly PilM family ATPase